MTGTALQIIKWLAGQKQDVVWEIKKRRKKRSLDANAYYWKLVTAIAEATNTPKPEVHNVLLRRYGQAQGIDGRLVTVYIPDTEKAAKQAILAEDYHIKPTSYVQVGSKGQVFRQYVMLRGSRTYDSREMSVLIDGALDECKQVGIHIDLTPAEMERYEQHHQTI